MRTAEDVVRLHRYHRFDPVMNRYAAGGIGVLPNPPRVGMPTTIYLRLKNAGMEPLTVHRIEMKIAQFGMGVSWEELPTVGPLYLPVNPDYIEEVKMQWMPLTGGHRCVRATLLLDQVPHALHFGCNLHVIETDVESSCWTVPFRLGNPEEESRPIVLGINNDDQLINARIMVRGRLIQAGEAIWLKAYEEVDALLVLQTNSANALISTTSIEAFLRGKFLDGIRVVVYRRACSSRYFATVREEAITEEVPIPSIQARVAEETVWVGE